MRKTLLIALMMISASVYLISDARQVEKENLRHINMDFVKALGSIRKTCKEVPLGHNDYLKCQNVKSIINLDLLERPEDLSFFILFDKELRALGFTLPPIHAPGYSPKVPVWKRIILYYTSLMGWK